MRNAFRNLAVGLLLTGSVTACADLDVANPNDADAGRALTTAGDVVSLIASAYNSWFVGVYDYNGPGLFLSNASFQHTAPWANAGMEYYGRIPRQPVVNDASHTEYLHISHTWYQSYRAIAGVSDGLRALNDADVASELSAQDLERARAFGKYVLGLAHGTVAVLYNGGFRIDETVEVFDASGLPVEQPFLEYPALMDAAFGYFDEAIALADGKSWTLPSGWMQASDVSGDDLAALAHSMKARFRANIARTPAERAAVDWAAVIADVDAGYSGDFVVNMDAENGWYNEIIDYGTFPGWSQSPYFIYGMADQSGDYQAWLALSIGAKDVALPNGDPVLIVTPDERFPQGTTHAEQLENPGTYIVTRTDMANVWQRPDRGTWRWSYYKDDRYEQYYSWTAFDHNEIDHNEMQLLKAEGLYRQGQLAAAADIINVTRTAAGLNETDAAGTNTSCVPKLPDGTCGDLWEMLKWEKRIEVAFEGLFGAPWYFDSRGWGDLWLGTTLQLPVPCRELQVLNMLPCYSYGGVGSELSSPGSSYAFPHEMN